MCKYCDNTFSGNANENILYETLCTEAGTEMCVLSTWIDYDSEGATIDSSILNTHGIPYIHASVRIKYCPFCGKELDGEAPKPREPIFATMEAALAARKEIIDFIVFQIMTYGNCYVGDLMDYLEAESMVYNPDWSKFANTKFGWTDMNIVKDIRVEPTNGCDWAIRFPKMVKIG